MAKRKIAVYSNSSLCRTGFGKHARILLQWLNKNGYDAFEMAAGSDENDPKLQGLPWRSYGLTPSDPNILHQINQSEGGRAVVGYGFFKLEEVIQKEKPDVIIAIEDSWAWSPIIGKAFYRELKDNWVFWSPIDSLPILPAQIDFVKNSKHFAVKATFAQKALKEKGLDVDFWGALSDFNSFYPARDLGLDLRRRSGISDDTFLFGFVFRNQLRKLIVPLIQGFKEFQTKNPDKKAKLVLHTDPKENWDIPRCAEIEGVALEDILFTKICPSCKEVTIAPYKEDKEICKCRRGEIHTPNTQNGVNEAQLNAIYNSFDGYIHPVNSGGAEMPIQEAAHVGLPIGTVNYAYGEMYIESGHFDSIPFTWYDEVQSLYKKARVTPQGVREFMEKVVRMTSEEKEKHSAAMREWALEFCDSETICQKVKKTIDSIGPANYDWGFPNANPIMPNVEDDDEWIKELHYAFFGDMFPSPDNYNFIKNSLNSGATRESIYKRSQEVVRSMGQIFDPKDYFEEDGKKRILIALEKSIGDCLCLLPALEQLVEKYPLEEWNHYIMTANENRTIFGHLEHLKFVPVHNISNALYWEGTALTPKLVDIMIQPFSMTQALNSWTKNGNSLI